MSRINIFWVDNLNNIKEEKILKYENKILKYEKKILKYLKKYKKKMLKSLK